MKTIDEISQQLRDITSRNGALNVRLFGSMAIGTATLSSNLDLLVDLAPGRDLLDLIGMNRKLKLLPA